MQLQVKQLVQETESEFGPVDILVNNAGVMYYTDMVNKHQDEWDRQIDINCKVCHVPPCSTVHTFWWTVFVLFLVPLEPFSHGFPNDAYILLVEF